MSQPSYTPEDFSAWLMQLQYRGFLFSEHPERVPVVLAAVEQFRTFVAEQFGEEALSDTTRGMVEQYIFETPEDVWSVQLYCTYMGHHSALPFLVLLQARTYFEETEAPFTKCT